ncbi:MAG: response regulator transcription factor, partial [Acidobacteriota bacterium]|nr:response regulator transcription factor [Acidobacteriota bacterium]
MGQEIRILLVDDHSLFREGLSRLLEAEPDFRIVGNCASVAEALAVLEAEPADLVLLDYDLGHEQGSEQGSDFIRLAKKNGFDLRVLMVTAGMSDTDTLRALENGASGIFLKHSPP